MLKPFTIRDIMIIIRLFSLNVHVQCIGSWCCKNIYYTLNGVSLPYLEATTQTFSELNDFQRGSHIKHWQQMVRGTITFSQFRWDFTILVAPKWQILMKMMITQLSLLLHGPQGCHFVLSCKSHTYQTKQHTDVASTSSLPSPAALQHVTMKSGIWQVCFYK